MFKSKINFKKIKIITILTLINLAVIPDYSNAQTTTQSASISISNASQVATVSAPIALTIPTSFSYHNTDNIVYSDFSPDNTANHIRVADTRNSGGFIVDLTATDFTNGTGNSIPYQNIGIVTLSGTDHPDSVNYDGTNTPPTNDSGTVFAPLHCDFPEGSTIEKCKNKGQGFINLSGAGAVSDPFLIIDGQNPTTGGRKGSWYIGLGLQLTIPPGLDTDTYNSTITITLTST